MTRDQFQQTAAAILGTVIGWQTKIAERLGVNARRVREWVAKGETPEWVDLKLAEMIRVGQERPWPRDEWLVGDARGADGKRREYVAHLQVPRFVARVVMVDDDGLAEAAEQPADILSGVVYSSDDFVLCEIEWIDPPRPGEVSQLLEAAADAVTWEGS